MQKLNERITKTLEKLSDPESYNVVCHEHFQGEPLPSIAKLKRIIDLIREILFPGYFGSTSLQPETTRHYMGVYLDELYNLLSNEILSGMCFECSESRTNRQKKYEPEALHATADFIEYLPEIRKKLVCDVNATYVGDPAARNHGEVIFCYPGIRAITNYRIAHRLLELGVPLIPRFITEMAHSETGIDIHPRARIGESFMIDHGTGVVIGSTSIIGNHVKIYQGVTLGAKSFPLDEKGHPIKGIPRHPIIGDHVVIYAGATLLGRITIGANSIIGGNVWLTQDVEANSRIIQTKPNERSFNNGSEN